MNFMFASPRLLTSISMIVSVCPSVVILGREQNDHPLTLAMLCFDVSPQPASTCKLIATEDIAAMSRVSGIMALTMEIPKHWKNVRIFVTKSQIANHWLSTNLPVTSVIWKTNVSMRTRHASMRVPGISSIIIGIALAVWRRPQSRPLIRPQSPPQILPISRHRIQLISRHRIQLIPRRRIRLYSRMCIPRGHRVTVPLFNQHLTQQVFWMND